MKKALAFLCALATLAVTGCAGISPAYGLIHAEVKWPHIRTEVVNDGVGSKVGVATSQNVLGWVATGDCSIAAAMRNGGITTVYTVDHSVRNILGVYAEWSTIVTGE